MRKAFMVMAVALSLICTLSAVQTVAWATFVDSTIQVPGVGSDAQGAGIAFVNLDGDPRPEMVLMAYDNSTGTKYFRYKIGWNVNTSGAVTSWSSVYQVASVSSEAQGAGVAFVNLDSNPRPEMVLMSYNNDASGAKVFRYKIGWNVSTTGVASSWGSTIQVPGVGSGAYGAGIAFVNLDGNPRPEIILMAYDNSTGTKNFRYKIGWNVSTTGVATSWSPVYQVAGVAPEVQTQGAGIAFVNLDSDPRPEMILMAYEKGQLGSCLFKYRIGWNVNASGAATVWDGERNAMYLGSDVQTQGADLVIYDINGNGKQDLVAMSYDKIGGLDYFRYSIIWDFMYPRTTDTSGQGVDIYTIEPPR